MEQKQEISTLIRSDSSDAAEAIKELQRKTLLKLDSAEAEAFKVVDPVKELKTAKLLFFLTFLYPGMGYFVYFKYRRAPKDSQRYIWARRGMVAGTMLGVVYSYIFCSFVNIFLAARRGDILGYSYPGWQKYVSVIPPV